jgi:phosphinothricin acetyltransferase
MLIRAARPDDLPQITAISNHYVLHSAAVFGTETLTPEQRRPWFRQFAAQGPYRLFVAEERGVIFGYAGSVPFLPGKAYAQTVEVIIFLAPGHTRRGLGTRLYRALFEALAHERLHRAYAGIVLPNRGSLYLHRRFGFQRAGLFHEYARKDGRYHSSLLMEKRLAYPIPARRRTRDIAGRNWHAGRAAARGGRLRRPRPDPARSPRRP